MQLYSFVSDCLTHIAKRQEDGVDSALVAEDVVDDALDGVSRAGGEAVTAVAGPEEGHHQVTNNVEQELKNRTMSCNWSYSVNYNLPEI